MITELFKPIREARDCDPTERTKAIYRWLQARKMPRLAISLWHLLYGLDSNIPLCCVLEYIVRERRGQRPAARFIADLWLEPAGGFVPCRLHARCAGWTVPITTERGKYLNGLGWYELANNDFAYCGKANANQK
jgi:hypothetical protein